MLRWQFAKENTISIKKTKKKSKQPADLAREKEQPTNTTPSLIDHTRVRFYRPALWLVLFFNWTDWR